MTIPTCTAIPEPDEPCRRIRAILVTAPDPEGSGDRCLIGTSAYICGTHYEPWPCRSEATP